MDIPIKNFHKNFYFFFDNFKTSKFDLETKGAGVYSNVNFDFNFLQINDINLGHFTKIKLLEKVPFCKLSQL